MPAQLITVTPSKGPGSKISWELCHKAPQKAEVCGKQNNYPVVILGRNSGQNAGDQVFTVTINDKHNLGIKFSSDPLWIQAATKPTSPVIDSSQIHSVTPGATQLIFKDKNDGAPVTLVYQLNFVGADNKPVTAIDPDIKNGGTTIAGSEQMTMLVAGAGLLLLLAAIWLSLRAMRRRTQTNVDGRL